MPEEKKDSGLIVVGGLPRSGTSLFQQMLEAHPNIWGGPEFEHLEPIVKLYNSLLHGIREGRIDTICNQQQVVSAIHDLITGLLTHRLNDQQLHYVSEKTPSNLVVFQQLAGILPHARFIWVLRDPRAVISSLKEVRKRGSRKVGRDVTGSVAQNVMAMNRMVNKGFASMDACAGRFMFVKYEALIHAPEPVARKVCEFLNLEWSDQMLSPEKYRQSSKQHMVDQVWYTEEMYTRKIDASSENAWRKKLTPGEQYLVNKVFAKQKRLVELGYDFSNRVGLLGQLEGWLRYYVGLKILLSLKHRLYLLLRYKLKVIVPPQYD